MASISKFHVEGCSGNDCACPWRLDYRPQGMRGPRQRIEFPTKKAAEKHLAATAVKVARGEYIEPAKIPTFAKAAEEWLKDRSGRHPATLDNWRTHLRHLSPLDDMRLDRIDVAKIELLRDDLREKLGARTVGGILTTAGAVFKLAVRRRYVTQNVTALAERPHDDAVELVGSELDERRADGLRAIQPDEVFSTAEIARIIEHANPGLYQTLIATTASTGMRAEEVTALRWSDVDLESGLLHVRRSLSWARGTDETGKIRPKFFAPKTKSGTRTLPLPAGLIPMLKAWKLRCPPGELVFCRPDGQPLYRSHILRLGLYPALRRAGLRGGNLKTLRHSFASGLISALAPVTEVQHLMGHKDPSTTLKVYSHWYKDRSTGTAARYAGEFLPSPAGSGQKMGTENRLKLITA